MNFGKRFALSLGLNVCLVLVVLGMSFSQGTHTTDFNVGGHENTNFVPAWSRTLAVKFPNCHDIDKRPEHVIPNEVVLVPVDGGKAYREQFSVAWSERHSGKFFTVGYCN